MIDFGPELRKRIAEEIERRGAAIAAGVATDFADYKGRCGELNGLNAALAIADEIQKSINEE